MTDDVAVGRDPASRRFWAAIGGGRLALPWCELCARHFFYPRRWCPGCGTPSEQLVDVAGAGTVCAVSEVAVPFFGLDEADVPYLVALVDLDEGVRLPGRISTDNGTVAIGDRVRFDASRAAAESRLFFTAGG